MKDFLNLYTELIETNHEEIGKVSSKLHLFKYLVYTYKNSISHSKIYFLI